MKPLSRVYSSRERVADGVVHAAGIVGSLAGTGVLLAVIIGALPALPTAAIIVYLWTMVVLFAVSAGNNLVRVPRLKDIFHRLDHAAIYFKIAGTYTPLTLIKMASLQGYGLLAGIWIVTAFGALAKLVWPHRFLRTSYVLYLLAGWAGLVFAPNLFSALSTEVLVLLVLGGVLYTVGVVFHLWESLPYHTAVWHAFVLLASACHFSAIVFVVAPELRG